MWGNTYKTRIQKLMQIQKKIVRLITFKSYSEHTEMIFKNLEILNVYEINDYLTSIFMFRYFNLKNLPETFAHYFVTNNEVHHYSTRKHPSSNKTYNRTNNAKHTLSNNGIDLWNGLNNKYKNIISLHTFKRKLTKRKDTSSKKIYIIC